MRCAVHDSRSMPIASTSTGILPTACVASVWKMIPFSLASLPMAATSWMVPISLLANITEIRIVLSVSALRISSVSMTPSGCTGTYVTWNPCRSRRLNVSMLARCSMTVVTMWLPFSLYISATPLRARLIASVPPEVKTSSFGSRAPISVAILARAASTAPSASHPNGWLRLAGCPNFSVKYGSIASTTRGSHGVVDCASMKIGNFSPIVLSSTLFVSSPRTAGPQPRDVLRLALPVRQQFRHVGARQLGQAHGVQHLRDRRLDLVDGSPQVALLHLRALGIFQARDDVDRPLQRSDHLAHRDLGRPARQRVAPLGPVGAHDQPLLGQPLEDLGHELRRDCELLGDPLGAHSAEAVVDGDIMNRHQPVIGALGESEHSVTCPCLSRLPLYRRWFLIGDCFGRILPLRSCAVNGKG